MSEQDKLVEAMARKAEEVITRRLHQGRLDGYTLEASQEIARAALSAIEAEDWQVVPKTETMEQQAAGYIAWRDDPLKRSSTLYRAMLAAAPKVTP
jgi:hypothetical protein